MKIQVKLGQENMEIEVSRQGEKLLVELAGQTHELRMVGRTNGVLVVEVNGRFLHLAGTKQGYKRQLWLNGRCVAYERLTAAGGDAEDVAGLLSASIPAVVADVLVKVGDEVSAGDKLILLESMKMIIPIEAPHDGIVADLNCATGDAVQPGLPLVEIRTAE